MQQKIVLTGYMGSGKTSVARHLSRLLGVERIDLDEAIEIDEQMSVAKLFEMKGEIYFRKAESRVLNKLLTSPKPLILSVGGGTPCYAQNMELINRHAVSFYLKTSLNELFDRLIEEKTKRPLISHIADENLKEFIAKHLFERTPFYEQAKHIISTDGLSANEVAKKIAALI